MHAQEEQAGAQTVAAVGRAAAQAPDLRKHLIGWLREVMLPPPLLLTTERVFSSSIRKFSPAAGNATRLDAARM